MCARRNERVDRFYTSIRSVVVFVQLIVAYKFHFSSILGFTSISRSNTSLETFREPTTTCYAGRLDAIQRKRFLRVSDRSCIKRPSNSATIHRTRIIPRNIQRCFTGFLRFLCSRQRVPHRSAKGKNKQATATLYGWLDVEESRQTPVACTTHGRG